MIRVRELCKSFKLYNSPSDRLKEILFRVNRHRLHKALDRVSFSVSQGEALGIVGRNGSGKSTLLKLLTGVLLPDSGHVQVQGRITGLLELGTGFNMEFSGQENIRLNGLLLGMSKEEVEEKRQQIIDFTELGEFINEPLKTYSSGMVMRLAFAVAIHAEPRAFVVDEALSVGDAYFQQKCMRRIKSFREQGGSIIFVSHDMNAVKVLCDRVLLLNNGRVLEEGDPESVINAYNFLLAKWGQGEQVTVQDAGESCSYGNERAVITSIRLLDESGNRTEIVPSGKPMCVEVEITAQDDLPGVSVGVLLRDRFGQDIFGTNSFHLGVDVALKAGRPATVRYEFDELNLGPGKYTVTAALHTGETHMDDCYHWVDRACAFEVVAGPGFRFIGLNRLQPRLVTLPSGKKGA